MLAFADHLTRPCVDLADADAAALGWRIHAVIAIRKPQLAGVAQQTGILVARAGQKPTRRHRAGLNLRKDGFLWHGFTPPLRRSIGAQAIAPWKAFRLACWTEPGQVKGGALKVRCWRQAE